VNGKHLSAVLDSGSGTILIDHAAAHRLAIRQGNHGGNALGGGKKAQPFFPVMIASLRFGPLALVKTPGVAMTLTPLSTSAGFPVDILLGHPVLAVRPLTIDYATQQITFQPADARLACDHPVPISIKNGVPMVTVRLRTTANSSAVPLHMIVDLGTRHFAVIIGGAFLKSPAGKALAKSGAAKQVGTGTGGAITGTIARVDRLTIGTQKFHNMTVALTNEIGVLSGGYADGTLGVPLWRHGQIGFDYAHHQLCLKTSAN
jgi:hypothetical protein